MSHTDKSTEFTNKLSAQVCRNVGIIHTTTPVYHAQANPTGRVNSILKNMIIFFLHDKHQDWDIDLPEFRFAYNSAVHGTLKISLAVLNYGWNPLLYRSMRRGLEKSNQHARPQPDEGLQKVKRLDHLRDLV